MPWRSFFPIRCWWSWRWCWVLFSTRPVPMWSFRPTRTKVVLIGHPRENAIRIPISCWAIAPQAALRTEQELANVSSFYDLSAKDIHGNLLHFHEFRGRVVIIVNVASYCGYTKSHYEGLVELWSHVQNEPVDILAFPCNQFGGQEIGMKASLPLRNRKVLPFAWWIRLKWMGRMPVWCTSIWNMQLGQRILNGISVREM